MSHYNGCGCSGGCNSCTSHNEIQQAVNDALAFEKENLEQYETNAAQSATDAAKEAAKAAESASAAAQSQTNAETAASTATQAASSVTNTAVVLEETAERIEQAQDLLEEQISAVQTKPVYFEVSTPTSSLVLPETETVFNVRSIYIASARQDVGYGFTFDKATRTITLADEITADDIAGVEEGFILVTAICDVYSSDDPTSFPIILASNVGASNIGTSAGITVEEALSTNNVNTREQWRRQLADAGLTLVDGSFEQGATVQSTSDAVWDIASGQCYVWAGSLPKTVPANSTPESSGGVSSLGWEVAYNNTAAGGDKTLLQHFKAGGQFDVDAAPEDIQAVAGISFGGKHNRGMLLVDDRGRLKVSAAVDGLPTAMDVHVPYAQGVGAFNGPFKDTQVKFPASGQADENTSFGLLFNWDDSNKLPRLAVTSPYGQRQMGAYAFDKIVWGTPIFDNVLELAPLSLIGRSLAKSYDTFYPHSDTGFRFHKFATITNPNTLVGSYFTCLLCIGDYGSNLRKTFTVEVNIPSPVTALTQKTVNEQVRVMCLSEGTLVTPSSGNGLPKIGVVQNTATGVVDVYLAIPSKSAYFSCTTLNAGRPDLVSFSWGNLRNSTTLAQMSGTSPTGVIWARMDFPFTTRRTFKMNDGKLVYVPTTKSVLRIHSGSTKGDLNEYPYAALNSNCSYSIQDFESTDITVTVGSDNVVSVTGCALDSIPFRFTLPPPLMSNTDSHVLRVITNDVSGKNFSFSLHRRTYTINTSVTPNTIVVGLSDPMAIPTDTWIDVCVAK